MKFRERRTPCFSARGGMHVVKEHVRSGIPGVERGARPASQLLRYTGIVAARRVGIYFLRIFTNPRARIAA